MTREESITGIAAQVLYVATLETRASDALDFHLIACWRVKAALESAYEAGHAAALAKITIVHREPRP